MSESTLKERDRRLRRIDRDLQGLKERGIIDSNNPKKMGDKDVGGFVNMLIKRGLKGKSFEHELTALNAVLEYAGNPAVKNFKKRHGNLFRRQTKTVRLPSLEREEVDRIIEASTGIDDSDWTAMESYAIVVLALASGGRHKELRLGHMDDLRLEDGDEHYHIAHPKGEDTYAEPRDPPLRPECVPFLKRYMVQREKKYLDRPDNDALFPALRSKKERKELSEQSVCKMVRWVREHAGVEGLDIHICRRTFAQLLLDEGADIETVSVLMGHKTTSMTEKAYCRKKEKMAARSARDAWSYMTDAPPRYQAVNPPVIETSKWDTGYIG